ncbi:AMP-binding protein [Streptomyces sp. SCSIO 75703]|uniref:AMP-binding protein n=1 Tax=Streptomyces sp. SCSIO 75703 TaxID=3112165 RepID=UPI0030D439B3
MSEYSAHVDHFVQDHLPPREQWPELVYDLPDLRLPDRLNCAVELLDGWSAAGRGAAPCLITADTTWTFADLRERIDRIAHVLVEELGVRPGNRVMLLGYNSPMLLACWYAVVKAGAVAVTVVPSLRSRELAEVARRARVAFALCDHRLAGELRAAQRDSPLRTVLTWGGPLPQNLDGRMRAHPAAFEAVETAADDPCLIAFTSGSTGVPKAAVHTHREVLAVCRCFSGAALHPTPRDIFIGSPPIAFTFGLLALACYPVYVGASVVLLERAGPEELVAAIERHGATMCFSVPTVYRTWLRSGATERLSSLRVAISSAEPLPRATWLEFHQATGLELVNCLGSTEMLHAFMTTGTRAPRPGSVGRPVRGYRAVILGPDGQQLGDGEVGRLAVKGPSGCRYLDDPRQAEQVQGGWNLTGDLARRDPDGYYWVEGRRDDIIVSAGYNISAAEVEETLLEHPGVADCLVVPVPDAMRGQAAKAYVVPTPRVASNEDGARALQDFVRRRIAAYKCPREVEFIDALPRTATGKVARHRLKASARDAR